MAIPISVFLVTLQIVPVGLSRLRKSVISATVPGSHYDRQLRPQRLFEFSHYRLFVF